MANMQTSGWALACLCILFSLQFCSAERFSATQPGEQPWPHGAAPALETKGQPWPMPQTYKPSEETQKLDRYGFLFRSTGEDCDTLQQAFKRYSTLVFPSFASNSALKFRPYNNAGYLTELVVSVKEKCEEWPSLEMDESYSLSIATGSAQLKAKTVWGALRGLETFSHLVYEDDLGSFQVNNTEIEDFPRFAHRGVLLDTSRHFIHKDIIKQNLDAMAYNKLNVFHWHIVDEESFPYESAAFPQVTIKGAYPPYYNHIYTREDVKEILEYGRLRGIRVVPEFDTPGHSRSWGYGQPGLLTECYDKDHKISGYGPINPIKNSTYGFLSELMKEIIGVFPDKYLHLGGDEVPFGCWKSNPDISAFMKKMSYGSDYGKLEQFYMQKLLDIVGGLNSGYIIWQEVVDNGVKVRSDTVVHVWKGGYQAEMAKVTGMGYKTLLSAPWYLDYISTASDWKKYYMADPANFNGTDAEKKLVMGGEACLWGEWVDGTNVASRLWPRASAVAERLWSSASLNNTDAASPRFEENRCRMVGRGIPAEPQNGPSYCRHEIQPNVVKIFG